MDEDAVLARFIALETLLLRLTAAMDALGLDMVERLTVARDQSARALDEATEDFDRDVHGNVIAIVERLTEALTAERANRGG